MWCTTAARNKRRSFKIKRHAGKPLSKRERAQKWKGKRERREQRYWKTYDSPCERFLRIARRGLRGIPVSAELEALQKDIDKILIVRPAE